MLKIIGCRGTILQRLILAAIILLTGLTACAASPISPQERIFSHLSLDYLGEYQLSASATFANTPIGGLSGITYDPKIYSTSDSPGFRFYAISDDAHQKAAPRFYSLRLELSATAGLKNIQVENVTFLTDFKGNLFSRNSLHPESIALSPRNSVFIANSNSNNSTNFALQEFDLKTGKLLKNITLPPRYTTDENSLQGVQKNQGFAALTLDPESFSPDGLNPFRLFAATAAPLLQDVDATSPHKLRLLHYIMVNKTAQLVSENLYPMDVPFTPNSRHQLTELVAIGQGGYLLSLECSQGDSGYAAQIFQVFTGDATDTSRIPSLKAADVNIFPLRKKLLFDLQTLGISIGNLQGMTLGPRLPDGSQSLILMSNNNFQDTQATQFLAFRLQRDKRQKK